MDTVQAFAECSAAGLDEVLTRTPSAGGVTLLLDEVEGVGCGVEIFFVAERQLGRGRGAQRVHMAVSMATG